MRLTRRKSILTLISTVLIILGFRSYRSRTQRKFSNSLQKNELSQALDVLSVPEIDKERMYQNFLKAAASGFQDNPALLYQGIQTSPYKEQINDYPSRLNHKPDGENLVNDTDDDKFSSYPIVGQLPIIEDDSLQFLHEDIKEACICIGRFSSGEFKTKWLGRNALSNQEFWSATKFIPVLNLVSSLNTSIPDVDVDSCIISGVDQQGNQRRLPLYNFVRDVVSYEEKIATSNSVADMFKRFSSQLDLENWLQNMTGNKHLIFRGDYGEEPFINQPKVIQLITEKVIAIANSEPIRPDWTDNTMSAYDLTRAISMLGWHNYIPPESRLPGVKWKNLKSIIRAMGTDPARFTDLAIKELGLQNTLDSVVILSKIGNGVTILRKRTEAVYVALVQFVVRSPEKLGQTKLLTLSMALKAARAKAPRDLNREVVELDARMATEVTQILQKALMSELV
ncbi:MAG: hypothetical protein PUP92_23435 [Rhizonema sp. PD38]|nr:hypothetical protein [Rhizonema sp. PD38]